MEVPSIGCLGCMDDRSNFLAVGAEVVDNSTMISMNPGMNCSVVCDVP